MSETSRRIHYFRIPHEYWRDRLERMKALGCNSVQVRGQS